MELAATKEYLEAIIDQQAAANEELKSANEEILSANPDSRVSIMDQDTEALRHLRNKLSHHGKRVKIVRRAPTDLRAGDLRKQQ